VIAADHPEPPAIDTLDVSELLNRIGLARSAGRSSEAEAFCRAALDREPQNPSLYALLGWIAHDRGDYSAAVASARRAEELPEHDAVAVARLLVYAAAASGDWRLADETLLRLAVFDEASARAIALETAPAFLAFIDGRRQNLAFEEAVTSLDHTPAMISVVAPDVFRKIRATASACHLALDDGETAIELFGRAIEASPSPHPTASRLRADDPRPLLVTSLMPVRLEIQRAAVASWRRLGFDVASLNAPDEIDRLRDQFEGVAFHPATSDARAQFGRPLVYVDDMLAIRAKASGGVGGLINSDIVLTHDADAVVSETLKLAKNAFIFGQRVEVDRLEDGAGSAPKLYLFGYDWFLFPTDQAGDLAGAGMVFGAPWWDLWLPLRAKSIGMDIVNVRRPVALHESHPTRWNSDDSDRMGLVLASEIVAGTRETRPVSRFQHRMVQLASVLKSLEPEALKRGDTLDWLAPILRGLIQREAEPFGTRPSAFADPFWDSEGRI
jgi:tetratricopeptide (TPR) repeat protein